MRCFLKGNVVFKSYARYGKLGLGSFLKVKVLKELGKLV
jgi:DNA-directed RNA polymerase subunit N (RpoN/RPB10)